MGERVFAAERRRQELQLAELHRRATELQVAGRASPQLQVAGRASPPLQVHGPGSEMTLRLRRQGSARSDDARGRQGSGVEDGHREPVDGVAARKGATMVPSDKAPAPRRTITVPADRTAEEDRAG